MNTAEQTSWLTIQQTADRWGVGYDTVRRDVLSGKIPTLRVGSIRRIALDVIERMEREAKQQEISDGLRKTRRVAAFVASGKDHYPDC